MDWGKIAGFFRLEAIATYVAFLGTAAFWLYQAWKSKQGRHVVCTMKKRPFSHLTLSDRARELVTLEFTGEDPALPTRIDTLSQAVIDIKNDSDTDSLNDVRLEFCTPEARVLKVWWEDAPPDLPKESQLWWPSRGVSSGEEGEPIDPSSTVRISLSQLMSWEKYEQEVRVGILADGELESISMIALRSAAGVPPNQVWTAKFVDFDEFEKKSEIIAYLRFSLRTVTLGLSLALFGLVTFRLLVGPISLGFIPFRALLDFLFGNLSFFFGYVSGFLVSGALGYVLQRRRAVLGKMGAVKK